MWEIRPITTKEDENSENECTREVPIPGKPNMYRYKLDATEYMTKLAVASIVFPNTMMLNSGFLWCENT